jgi:hypothetical protein
VSITRRRAKDGLERQYGWGGVEPGSYTHGRLFCRRGVAEEGNVLRGEYAKRTIITLAIAILVVEGFLTYRWYEHYYVDSFASSQTNASTTRDVTSTSGTTGSSVATTTAKKRERETTFVHRAAPENVVNNSTYIDSSLTNDNLDAILQVKRVGDSGEEISDGPSIGVWYDENRGGRWAIFNQDLTPMSADAAFSVSVSDEPGDNGFVHRATSKNIVDNKTYIDDPLTNERANVAPEITPNWNPGGGDGVYNDHSTGVRYDTVADKWMILNQDFAPMPEGAAFNVSVPDESTSKN